MDKPLDQLIKENKKSKVKKVVKGKNAKKEVVKSSKKDTKGIKMKVPVKKSVVTKRVVSKKVVREVPRANILARLGKKDLPGTLVKFGNLNFNITANDITELCSTIGLTEKIAVPRSKGFANVVFSRRTDALKAVKKFDGLTLDGRPMHVTVKDSDSNSATSRKIGSLDTAISKALLFGGALAGQGRKTLSTSISESSKKSKNSVKSTKSTQSSKSAPVKSSKKVNGDKKGSAKDTKKKNEKKTKPKKEVKPEAKAEDLDADMDSYFKAKKESE